MVVMLGLDAASAPVRCISTMCLRRSAHGTATCWCLVCRQRAREARREEACAAMIRARRARRTFTHREATLGGVFGGSEVARKCALAAATAARAGSRTTQRDGAIAYTTGLFASQGRPRISCAASCSFCSAASPALRTSRREWHQKNQRRILHLKQSRWTSQASISKFRLTPQQQYDCVHPPLL